MQISYFQKSENNLKSAKKNLSFCEFNKLFSFQVLITLQNFRSKQTGNKRSYQKITKPVNIAFFWCFWWKYFQLRVFDKIALVSNGLMFSIMICRGLNSKSVGTWVGDEEQPRRQSKVDQVSRHKVIVHYLSTAAFHCVDRFYGFYMTWTLIRLFFEEEPSLGFRIVNIIFNLGQQSSKLPFLDHFVLEALSLLLRTLQLHKVRRVGSVTFYCDPCIWQKLRSYKFSHPPWSLYRSFLP